MLIYNNELFSKNQLEDRHYIDNRLNDQITRTINFIKWNTIHLEEMKY